jgi:mono/diheme cytochrome c family protein
MLARVTRLSGWLILVCLAGSLCAAGDRADEDHFESRIRPLLAKHCWKCHGPDKAESDLRLDSAAGIARGGATGATVIAGNPESSLLIRAVRQGGELKMPPDGKLSAQQIDDLAAWVKAGARWPKAADAPATGPTTGAGRFSDIHRRHWSFQPVRRPPLPRVKHAGWARSPIDHWILPRLEAQGIEPLPPAGKRTLLRRAAFDLIGLPPTPEQMAAFLNDESPDAFGRVVERLLASPQYGERWGRHWMDVVRYADTAGDNADYPVPEARLYRDYIVGALNADMPYDQFVREQLAGDLLARDLPAGGDLRPRYAEAVAATGFLALSRRYATAPYELMHLTIEDAIDTTGRAFLGLVLRCARCHDHKYDPITREDYYALYGIFASTRFPYAGSEEFASQQRPRASFVPLVPADEAARCYDEDRRRAETLKHEAQQLEETIRAAGSDTQKRRPLEERLAGLRAAMKIREKWGTPLGLPVAYAVADGKPVDQPLHLRGEPDQLGPVVPRGVPKFFVGSSNVGIPREASGRLQLARWLTDTRHPLTARVMVNRIWQHHFGQGLAGTPSNLGLRGELPTHPELLDYLADYFVRHGWSVKALHRLILNSATWQQASAAADADAGPAVRTKHTSRDGALDGPQSGPYAGFPRRRLDAEAIRDAMMFAAGTLRLDRPGPHAFPDFATWAWTQHTPFKAVYESPHRSVYLMRQRIQRHPYLALFDAPDSNVSTDVRTSATVPLQSLYLLNHPFVREQAAALARRVRSAGATPEERHRVMCQLAWSRDPSADEIQRATAFIQHYTAELNRSGGRAADPDQEAWASYARVLLTANEFFYLD